jgi:hypothetical protein
MRNVSEHAPDQREDDGGSEEREPERGGHTPEASEDAADRLPGEDASEHADE